MKNNIASSIDSYQLVTLSDPKSPAAEAYQTLRTNILFSALDEPVQSILVTSPLPFNGKTTTTVNLGITIARTGANVLLVDTDLRKPAMHNLFDLDNSTGLTNLLVEKTLDHQDVIRSTDVKNLYVVPSGPIPPNPSELIVSQAFARVLENLKKSYDYLLLDSPPVVAVTDPALLSRYTDGTILVIDFGRVPQEIAQKARDQLQNVKANILGVVINRIPANGYGYYYYYYQQYYGSREEKKGFFSRWKKKQKQKKK